jgi:hypothetical protein
MERVERLEKQNRKLKHAGVVALILAAAVFLMGQTAQKKTVEANEFILRDANGNLRAALGVDKDGTGLFLWDAAGKIRAALEVVADEPQLVLYDSAGKQSAALSIYKGVPGLGLFDSAGNPRATLDVGADGPGLTLSDQEGFEATIGTTDLGTTRTGESHKTSAASVVLFDKDKKVIWQAP